MYLMYSGEVPEGRLQIEQCKLAGHFRRNNKNKTMRETNMPDAYVRCDTWIHYHFGITFINSFERPEIERVRCDVNKMTIDRRRLINDERWRFIESCPVMSNDTKQPQCAKRIFLFHSPTLQEKKKNHRKWMCMSKARAASFVRRHHRCDNVLCKLCNETLVNLMNRDAIIHDGMWYSLQCIRARCQCTLYARMLAWILKTLPTMCAVLPKRRFALLYAQKQKQNWAIKKISHSPYQLCGECSPLTSMESSRIRTCSILDNLCRKNWTCALRATDQIESNVWINHLRGCMIGMVVWLHRAYGQPTGRRE